MTAKVHLLATCHRKGIPVISSMGAAGKRDPTQIRIGDLSETTVCPMAKDVRKILRKKYGFAAKEPFGITTVYSTGLAIRPLSGILGKRRNTASLQIFSETILHIIR